MGSTRCVGYARKPLPEISSGLRNKKNLASFQSMGIKFNIEIPTDSLLREDFKKVLDLLYRKYKSYIESNDSRVGGGEIWINQKDLENYNLSLDRCLDVLLILQKSDIISFDPATEETNQGTIENPDIFIIWLTTDFNTTYLALQGKLNLAGSNIDSPNKKKLITKDKNGNFLYDGAIIVMSIKTLHYNLVDILFNNADQTGFLLYKDIEKSLIMRGYPQEKSDGKIAERIRNILHNQLFRIAKLNGKIFANKTLDGRELIETIRGSGLKFNNNFL